MVTILSPERLIVRPSSGNGPEKFQFQVYTMSAGTTAILLNTRKVSLATENLSWWECLGCDSLASDQVKGAFH